MPSKDNRNACMLSGKLASHGYDWWWHSFVAHHKTTGELQPFFIEYFLINPALGSNEPVMGQEFHNKLRGVPPSYGMLKAGTWCEGSAAQIHNFVGVSQCQFSEKELSVKLGQARLSETELVGAVSVTPEEARFKPEMMTQPGSMSWNLRARKVLTYDVGVGASKPLREAGAFAMYWHVQGWRTEYEGEIVHNGQHYIVEPAESCGYQDKNWGTDYTNPWIWLNCNRFRQTNSPSILPNTGLAVGGGTPVLLGIPLKRKLLVAFTHEGELFEFHFLRIWESPRHKFSCYPNNSGELVWEISAENTDARIEILFSCPFAKMLKVSYENPSGQWLHRDLWNGGHAQGTVRLYRKGLRSEELLGEFHGDFGGCEYGVF